MLALEKRDTEIQVLSDKLDHLQKLNKKVFKDLDVSIQTMMNTSAMMNTSGVSLDVSLHMKDKPSEIKNMAEPIFDRTVDDIQELVNPDVKIQYLQQELDTKILEIEKLRVEINEQKEINDQIAK